MLSRIPKISFVGLRSSLASRHPAHVDHAPIRPPRSLRHFAAAVHRIAVPVLVALFVFSALLGGCQVSPPPPPGPSIEFTKVPYASEGGPNRLDTISGRVIGARPGDKIVLFARWGPWWVQPLTEHPFTDIQSDGTFLNVTHFGTQYAAVLADQSYHPPATADTLEGQPGVLLVATAKGRPPYWSTWWFVLSIIALITSLLLLLVRLRMAAVTEKMNVRFEERLAERARIARELHDSLLQGFQGLMFRLQAARDLLPSRPAEALQALDTILDRGDQVIAEGRSTVEDLRSPVPNNDIAQAITALGGELGQAKSGSAPVLRVLVEGQPRELDPILRDEIYRIAREALRNAFTHSHAREVEAHIIYGDSQFFLRVRDDGIGFDGKVFGNGRRAGHWGLPGMRERAAEFGGSLKVWSEHGAGTEVQLNIPSSAAYPAFSVSPKSWFSRRKMSDNDDPES